MKKMESINHYLTRILIFYFSGRSVSYAYMYTYTYTYTYTYMYMYGHMHMYMYIDIIHATPQKKL